MKLPEAVVRVAGPVDARLDQLFKDEVDRWSTVDVVLEAPFAALRDYVMAGGKRLRPAFCYWGFVGAGGDPADPAVVDAGAALEMLHTAALVHDDIIDGSLRRHGSPTVHVRFEGMHRSKEWAGAAHRFGEGTAILVGDLALVYSSRLLLGVPAQAAAVFEEMRLEVNVGQYLDIVGSAEGVGGDDAVDRAQRIRRYKTAKYTIERPLHLGAALGAPDRLEALAGPLSEFALPLGDAFQLKDDLLGVFGDPEITGKPVGDDLREGKPTMLAGLAARRDPSFNDGFGDPGLGSDDVARLQAIIETTGARTEVEAAVAELVSRAERALASLPLIPAAVAALGDLARFVAGRNR
ncbi:MAG TPA: polyprenyl synthetase family protein [Acidimicrobiales bacterium]|nr:polyprenyl synthetase family protein [Acidimicrobiales bacterium]